MKTFILLFVIYGGVIWAQANVSCVKEAQKAARAIYQLNGGSKTFFAETIDYKFSKSVSISQELKSTTTPIKSKLISTAISVSLKAPIAFRNKTR